MLDLVPPGGRVVVPRHSYQGTLAQLRHAEERGRVVAVPVDIADTEAVLAALDGAALVWIENPTNPALEVADVDRIAAAARARGVLVVADNTFATPILRRPLEQGADIVLHSATKAISGHSDVVMGAVITRDDALHADLLTRRSLHGAIPSPLDAYLALRGLRTLALRLERSQSNAQALLARLRAHAAVEDLRYPGFGTILSIVLADAASADAFVAAVRLCRHATSLGGVETTLERRRRWAGRRRRSPRVSCASPSASSTSTTSSETWSRRSTLRRSRPRAGARSAAPAVDLPVAELRRRRRRGQVPDVREQREDVRPAAHHVSVGQRPVQVGMQQEAQRSPVPRRGGVPGGGSGVPALGAAGRGGHSGQWMRVGTGWMPRSMRCRSMGLPHIGHTLSAWGCSGASTLPRPTPTWAAPENW
ncbi:hypothetical protein GCM10025866_04200 [Naasia aerilata]|uniref:Cystathionine gamma-synthase n=1 Tax=Naasia aerilata TaxID=1162966 RepID=A0ABN6XI27_9MICO|nr:hypothetical protein GCM10025866_04200 [Naasia aerilata]